MPSRLSVLLAPSPCVSAHAQQSVVRVECLIGVTMARSVQRSADERIE